MGLSGAKNILGVVCAVAALGYAAPAAASAAPIPNVFGGELSFDTHYDAYTDAAGTRYDPWEVNLQLTDVVYTISSGSTYQVLKAQAAYVGTPTEVAHTQNGTTCTTTYSIDSARPVTGSVSLNADGGATVSVTVPKIVDQDHAPCYFGTSKASDTYTLTFAAAGVYKLRNSGMIYKIAQSGTSDSPGGAYNAPSHQTESLTLFAELDWGRLKDEEKTEAKSLAKSIYQDTLGNCAEYQMSGVGMLMNMFGRGEAACRDGAALTYENALKQIDPPDPNFDSVALPAPASAPAVTPGCGRHSVVSPRRCRRIVAADRNYLTALVRELAVAQAIVTTLNRGNTAQASGSDSGEQLQALALAVYTSEERHADDALTAAGRRLASTLRQAHLNLVLGAKQTRKAGLQLLDGKLPPGVLGTTGVGKGTFTSTLSAALGAPKVGPLRLTSALSRSFPAGPTDVFVTPGGFGQLIAGLPLTPSQASTLTADAENNPPQLASYAAQLSGETRTFVLAAVGEFVS